MVSVFCGWLLFCFVVGDTLVIPPIYFVLNVHGLLQKLLKLTPEYFLNTQGDTNR